MKMRYHYGPERQRTTSYGAPLRRPPIMRPVAGDGIGENYVYGPMRTTPVAVRGVGDIASTMSGAVKTVLEFGSGFVVGQLAAPSAKDKMVYGVGGGLVSMMFGVIGLGVAALALQNMQK